MAEKRMQYVKDPRFFCDFSSGAIQQAAFGLGLLQARGLLGDEEHLEEYVQNFVTHVIAHEVGHALGLRHNFQASTLNSFEMLQDSSYTKDHGLSGSLMDYTPVNIAPAGQKQGQCWQTTLGPYDYWAIEYAYKFLPANSTEEEVPELRKIASRVAEPALAYGTDEDALFSAPTGIDPRSTRWDYSSDPLQFYSERMRLVQELWGDLETKIAKSGDRYQLLRRSFNQGFSELNLHMINASKYIGGIYNNRDHIGDPGGRLPYEPVPAATQRKALELLKIYAFGSDSFKLPPRLLNQLAMERFWTFEGNIFNAARLDYPIHQQVLRLQKTLLDRIYHPVLLSRLQDLEVKYINPKEAFTMADLFEGVRESVWSDVKKPDANLRIDSFRRGLQREYLKKVVDIILSPEYGMPEDARTLARYSLTQLETRLQKSLAGPAIADIATRAHLQDSHALITETLKAQQIRFVN